ncbi:uncharacterized protein [Coffea arabica]|uniref:Ubiquitin-like domain-containing protein n=1 Tax=Coffea arabica TaxID=13443 RepID=A0ABM4U664_COFAR
MYTVRDVKAIVESVVGFPVNEQSLMCDGQQLDDSKVLSSYHIAAQSILKMVVQNIQILVKDGFKTITLDVCQDVMIRIVKDKIFHKTGLPANPLFLESLFLENVGKPLDNFQSLPRYNI